MIKPGKSLADLVMVTVLDLELWAETLREVRLAIAEKSDLASEAREIDYSLDVMRQYISV